MTTPAFRVATELHALLHAVPTNMEQVRDTAEALLLLVAADAQTIGRMQREAAQHRETMAQIGAFVARHKESAPAVGASTITHASGTPPGAAESTAGADVIPLRSESTP